MESKLTDLTVSELKKLCEERGIAKSGIKPDLVGRIQEHDEKFRPQQPPRPTPPPPQRRSDHYRPQYDNVRQRFGDSERDQQRSPENIRRDGGHLRSILPTDPQQLIEDFRSNPGDSTAAKLNEEQLERICREHYMPWIPDVKGDERKTVIAAEYTTKAEELTKKRDAEISRVHTQYKNEMAKLDKDKEEKLEHLERDIAPWKENNKWWKPAFQRLTMLGASHGLDTSPKDYGPRNQRPSSYMASSPPTRLNPNSNQISLASSPTTPASSTSSGLKRQASNTTMASSTIAPALRIRDRSDPYIDAPSGPRADTLIEREPIGLKLTRLMHDPYIFVSCPRIRVSGENVHHMKAMLSKPGFTPNVRADETGYFLIFESEKQAELCFDHFNRRLFRGMPMAMKLRRRDGSRISLN